MIIELKEISIKDVVKGYSNSATEGCVAYDGKLDVRPPYQREFVYNDEQQKAVIKTILNAFPLNVMYWIEIEKDNTFELMDGQQRTLSICKFVNGDYSIIDSDNNPKYFQSLSKVRQQKFLDYKLMVYFCYGDEDEKTEWFKTINIAGLKLTNQEILNAIYRGTWVSDAKRYFSKVGCAAYQISENYLKKAVDRQELLECAISWACEFEGYTGEKAIEDYMNAHKDLPYATQLWTHFQNVITWISTNFTTLHKEMKNLPWGEMYAKYHNNQYDIKKMNDFIDRVLAGDDYEVTNGKGVYQFVLSGDEKYLSKRVFDEHTKKQKYVEQKGICPICGNHFEYSQMAGDHIIPWTKGGRTIKENCQMLCIEDNLRKSSKCSKEAKEMVDKFVLKF